MCIILTDCKLLRDFRVLSYLDLFAFSKTDDQFVYVPGVFVLFTTHYCKAGHSIQTRKTTPTK